jgi:hypothetical protein
VPEELELRYTLYPVAPVTEDQLTVMLVVDAAVAVTSAGLAGLDMDSLVFAETGEDWALSPALLLADTL